MANRYSSYSGHHSNAGQNRTNTMQSGRMQASNVSQQVSTTSLLAQLNTGFHNNQPYPLEASTSLVVNTWASGNVVDEELARKAWEHARRRAEDGCILLGSLHRSSPSLMQSFTGALPLAVPNSFFVAMNALKPFLHRVTPYNPSLPCYSALSSTFTLSMEGEIQGASLSLSMSGLDTKNGLLDMPAEQGHRAFDVFYYLLTSATAKEREFLGLKSPNQYALLRKSETYTAPSYLPTADDAAAAEDWRENLKALGIKGADFRNLLTVTASILRLGDAVGFLVDQEELENTCEEVGSMLDIDPDVLLKKCVTEEREILIGGIYEALVDWVITKLNDAIRNEMRTGQQIGSSSGSDAGMNTPLSSQDDAVSASITVVEVPQHTLAKAVSLKTIFDDSTGINAEMREDGVQFVQAGSSVMREMKDAVSACEADLDINGGAMGRQRDVDLDRRHTALEKVGVEAESDSFLRRILYPVSGQDIQLGRVGRFNLRNTLESSRVWFHLCLHPSDDNPASFAQHQLPWSAGSVSSQIRAWRLPEWANHRNKQLDFTADFDIEEFVDRYARLGCQGGREGVEAFILERGWSNGEVVVGSERVWIREAAWWEAESMLDMKPIDEISPGNMLGGMVGAGGLESGYSMQAPSMTGSGFFNQFEVSDSKDQYPAQPMSQAAPSQFGVARSLAPTTKSKRPGDYGLGPKGDTRYDDVTYDFDIDEELASGKEIQIQKTSFARRVWVAATWAMTWWIPSPLLKHVGRMKRPDVRLAWREKLLLIMIIFFMNACVIFYIIFFGKLLCPKWDKAWNTKEVGYHQGDDDFYVSFRGSVYDLSKFWKLDHSDSNIEVTKDLMQPFAGKDVSGYIVPPLWLACPGLVDQTPVNELMTLQSNTTLLYPQAEHLSGAQATDPTSKLSNDYWYTQTFLPKMKSMYKGELVFKRDTIKKQGQNDGTMRFIIDKNIYDLTSYFYTLKQMDDRAPYNFFGENVETLMQSNPGGDISKEWEEQLNYTTRTNSLNCLNNMFYIGRTDFRESAKCQVNNYILLSFMIILCVVIGTKFLAALQLGSKRRPSQQDKFVICQVPAYTEGEDQLRKGLDSLTALAYDNKRKLICVICDGMIVGGGNDRPTPKIVLDVLGVDPKIDPPALPFKSVGAGSEQLNYGKVYSGLYEYEGNVVPYVVVVKVGKESEQRKSKPGNRGKRDSQILLMSFLNRVHHRAPMSPLELEMFHQINNIIGVDPELYEYLFMVDADTKVKEDSLNRLVASCANDGKIAGICGETSLENEEGSWWTMIQVYEYYISHHLAKAFESLFGSVTCLPGCFCMYRLRTADKGRPLIISDKVIKEYADINVDTLHAKNLLSLGEDRYLTTLMTKHFPAMSYKFVPDAYALTEAPSEWSVLLSQRRRWINSTIHNLAELLFIKNLCGFCCFSMRFVVFIDLIGTVLLPSVCIYLGYLIYLVASGSGQFPLISVIMIAAVYGLQAIIFIVKRQWQHIGWMIIYIMAYPIYSFVLPIYSFWKQDDFSWGNTRIVLGERGDKKVMAVDDEGFDPRSIPLQRWDDYATANSLPGRRGVAQEKEDYYGGGGGGYEMDDMHSVYSSAKPASTILTGFPQHNSGMYYPPQSPGPGLMQRQSTWSHMSGRYTDNPNMTMAGAQDQQRLMSMGGMSDRYASGARTPGLGQVQSQSRDNLLSTSPGGGAGAGMQSPPLYTAENRARSPYGSQHQNQMYSRPGSTNNLAAFQQQGPTNEAITQAIRECLGEVDLDNVTKKQLKALAEQKLQCQLVGERRQYLDGQIDFELASM